MKELLLCFGDGDLLSLSDTVLQLDVPEVGRTVAVATAAAAAWYGALLAVGRWPVGPRQFGRGENLDAIR